MRIKGLPICCCLLTLATNSLAGARFDLRPSGVTVIPGDPPYAVVTPGQVLDVNVFLVDTGNPQGNISFRGVFLDFTDTAPSIVDANGWDGTDGVFVNDPNTPQNELADNPQVFNWPPSCDFGSCEDRMLPYPYWIYPLPVPIPGFQITMPDNGEVQLADIQIEVPSQLPAIIDIMNPDEQVTNPNLGAAVTFGFGGPGDPVINWTAANGNLTGGQLLLVPEPTTLLFLGFTGAVARRRSHQSRERKRPGYSRTAQTTG